MYLNRIFILCVVVFLGIGTLSGCRKKVDTIVNVYVKNVDNEPISGANVRLFGVSSEEVGKPNNLEFETVSDYSGIATFNLNEVYQLGQAGVAVLNIEVTKGAETGEGIVKVEQEIVSEETVFLQP